MDILQSAELFVIDLLSNKLPSSTVYHNLSHTYRVVNNMNELVEAEHISDEDALILKLAAWFHDTGFVKGHKNHEKESIQISNSFLKNLNVDPKVISGVATCIHATSRNNHPESLLEKIMIDADCGHLGKKSYAEGTIEVQSDPCQ